MPTIGEARVLAQTPGRSTSRSPSRSTGPSRICVRLGRRDGQLHRGRRTPAPCARSSGGRRRVAPRPMRRSPGRWPRRTPCRELLARRRRISARRSPPSTGRPGPRAVASATEESHHVAMMPRLDPARPSGRSVRGVRWFSRAKASASARSSSRCAWVWGASPPRRRRDPEAPGPAAAARRTRRRLGATAGHEVLVGRGAAARPGGAGARGRGPRPRPIASVGRCDRGVRQVQGTWSYGSDRVLVRGKPRARGARSSHGNMFSTASRSEGRRARPRRRSPRA